MVEKVLWSEEEMEHEEAGTLVLEVFVHDESHAMHEESYVPIVKKKQRKQERNEPSVCDFTQHCT